MKRRALIVALLAGMVGCIDDYAEVEEAEDEVESVEQAATIVSQGVKFPARDDGDPGNSFPDATTTGCKGWPFTHPPGDTKACWNTTGDYVYVRDGRTDGRSAVAWFIQDDDTTKQFVCRNKHGYESWAKCDFTWKKGKYYRVYLGTFDGTTGEYTSADTHTIIINP